MSRARPRRILIAESDRDVCELYARVITRLGHEPLLSPPAALETEDRGGFDLVLLEPALPGAVRLARALRLQRPMLPIVCVSIYAAGLLPESELLVLAPLAYLVKPCPLAELTEILTHALAAEYEPVWAVTT